MGEFFVQTERFCTSYFALKNNWGVRCEVGWGGD